MTRKASLPWISPALAALLCLALSGCLPTLGGDATPIQVVSPMVRVTADPDWPEVDAALNVARPQANPLLDSFNLLVRRERHEMLVFPGFAWVAPMPDLLQDELVRTLGDSGRFRGGIGAQGEARSQLTLLSTLRHFELVDDGLGAREIHLEVTARLVRSRDGLQLGTQTFRVSHAVPSRETRAMLDGYESALGVLLRDMSGWTVSQAASTPAVSR